MSLEAELTALIAAEGLVPPEKLVGDATIESLGLGSVDVVSILFEIENRYDITLADDELQKTTTISEIIEMVRSKCEAKDRNA